MTASEPHVCFVVTSDMTAGTFLHGYVAEMRRRKIAVTVVSSPGPGLRGLHKDVRTYGIPMRREPSPAADLVALFRLAWLFARIRPDVVVYATPKASLLSSIAAAVVGVRVRIYELWGLRMETASGPYRGVLATLERTTNRFSTATIANSGSLADRAVQLRVANRRPVVLGAGSSHGVDIDRFSPHASRPELDAGTRRFLAETDGFVLGFVGRLHPDKGVDVLLDAVKLCRKQGHRVRALLVGGDEGAELPDVSDLPVHVVGHVEDTRPYLAEMETIVLMTLREGFPNVILEAAAMQIPAVVSDSTGAIDSVADSETGFIVPVGDARALSRRIVELMSDSRLRSSMSENARIRASSQFSSSDICGLHVDFYVERASTRRSVRG
ncbi:glycosyltransferase family 4 protein [Microbacterium aerolatum]|uniref:glycosyltransferase family 4 protein n=1 Tax=Microbacterium aerolatum TaxID=153731 RepID=UPI00384D7176